MSNMTRTEDAHHLGEELTEYISPFNFSERKLKIGQWIDVKDTIDQWLEAQVIKVKNDQVYIH